MAPGLARTDFFDFTQLTAAMLCAASAYLAGEACNGGEAGWPDPG
jgi:hypothetical protein